MSSALQEPPPVAPETLTEARRAVANMLSAERLVPRPRRRRPGEDRPRHSGHRRRARRPARALGGGDRNRAGGTAAVEVRRAGRTRGRRRRRRPASGGRLPDLRREARRGCLPRDRPHVDRADAGLRRARRERGQVAQPVPRRERVREPGPRPPRQQFPDMFEINVDTADDGTQQPRVGVKCRRRRGRGDPEDQQLA